MQSASGKKYGCYYPHQEIWLLPYFQAEHINQSGHTGFTVNYCLADQSGQAGHADHVGHICHVSDSSN